MGRGTRAGFTLGLVALGVAWLVERLMARPSRLRVPAEDPLDAAVRNQVWRVLAEARRLTEEASDGV
jgi:hypothetical protein